MPIQRDTAHTETYVQGGVTTETHDADAITAVNSDFPVQALVAYFTPGTPANNSFAPGVRGQTVWLSLDLTTGRYRTSNNLTGVLPLGGALITGLTTNQRNLKNALEALANAIGLLPGTVVQFT